MKKDYLKTMYKLGIILVAISIFAHFIPWLSYGTFTNPKALDMHSYMDIFFDYTALIYFIVFLIFSLTSDKKELLKNIGVLLLFVVAYNLSGLVSALVFDCVNLIRK